MATDPEDKIVRPFDDRVKRSAPLGEKGRTGTNAFHGFIQTDEYVPELTGLSGIRTLDKMRRSDGMVRAVLRGLTMPLLSATWQVEPATEDQQDQDIAAEIEEGLFEGMSTAWTDVLRQIMTFLPLGFSIFEKVWEVRDVDGEQKVMIRKIAPRLQKSIYQFNTADDGGLDSVTQYVYSNGGSDTIELPIDRLLVFVNEKEGAQWQGTPILRPAYKHWWIKDNLYRIQAMAAERWGVGIPTVTLPADRSEDEDIRKAENILSNLRSHERGYAVWPAGYVFSLITSSTGGGGVMNLEPMITHHDRMIAVSVLAQFLTLGSTDTGSWALSNDQSALFLMVEQGIGDLVCDVINRHLIPEWVDYNYAGVQAYPQLKVTNIETRNIEKIMVGLAAAANAGLISPDPDLEDALRDGLGFPLIPRDENGQPIPQGLDGGVLPPGVVDTSNPLGTPAGAQGGAAGPSGAATNPTDPQAPQPATAPRPQGARLNAAIGDVTGDPSLLPNLVLAANYGAENSQIGHNKNTEAAKKAHKFLPARYTHTNGHPRCLMCGAEPMDGDPLHTEIPKSAAAYAFNPKRPLTAPEAHVDFEALDAALTEARARVADGVENPVQRIIRALAARAERALKGGDPSQLQADALGINTSELAAAIETELRDLHTVGATEVRKEMQSQLAALRADQRATLARETAVAEVYRQTFSEMSEQMKAGSTASVESFMEAIRTVAARPIVVQTGGTPDARSFAGYDVEIDPATGVIKSLVPKTPKE